MSLSFRQQKIMADSMKDIHATLGKWRDQCCADRSEYEALERMRSQRIKSLNIPTRSRRMRCDAATIPMKHGIEKAPM